MLPQNIGFFLFLRRFCTIIITVSSKVMYSIGCKVTIMQNRNTNLNDIYMSDRLQAQLQQIDQHAMTCVVAPMGYGKTTAVNWFLGERSKAPGTRVVRISIYSDNLAIFWRSVQSAFAHAGLDFLRQYELPSDLQGVMLLMDDLNRALVGTGPFYIFLDDYHLLQGPRCAPFLCKCVVRLPKNVHITRPTRPPRWGIA